MKPRLMFIAPMLGGRPNRTPDYLQILSARLSDQGYPVQLCSRQENRLRRLIDIAATLILRRQDFDVCIINIYSGLSFIAEDMATWICRYLKKPTVLELSGGALPEFFDRHPAWMRRVFTRPCRLVSPSHYIREAFAERGLGVQVVPNGMDLRVYPFKHRPRANPTLIWLRAFHQVYNPVDVIRATALVRERREDIRLLMTGIDKQDGSLDQVRQEIQRLQLESQVEISLGVPKAQVPAFLARGDIFINTTGYESFGITSAEAAACGLCLVTTNVGELPHIWKHERSALLVQPNAPDQIAAAVLRILDDDRLASTLSRNARLTAEQFDWSRVLPVWERIVLEEC